MNTEKLTENALKRLNQASEIAKKEIYDSCDGVLKEFDDDYYETFYDMFKIGIITEATDKSLLLVCVTGIEPIKNSLIKTFWRVLPDVVELKRLKNQQTQDI